MPGFFDNYSPHFAPSDLLVVGTLIILEGLLSADNALVMAMIVKHLPKEEQKRALFYGLMGAFIMRGIAIIFAGWLMNLWWLCGIGSVYLIYLAGKHFLTKHGGGDDETPDGKVPVKVQAGFWATVAQVEFTDLIFAVDSILVAVALVPDKHKIWIVYTGGFLGILLLRLAASFFIKLVTKYPALDHMAYGLVGWAGIKLASTSFDIYAHSKNLPEPHYLPKPVFWVGFVLITVGGIWYAVRAKRTADDQERVEDGEARIDRLEKGDFLVDDVADGLDGIPGNTAKSFDAPEKK